MEPLTTNAIVTLAFPKPRDNTTEKLNEYVLGIKDELRSKIRDKFRDNAEVVPIIQAAEQGSKLHLVPLGVNV